MKTPYRHTLAVPSKALALMIANEFNRQDKLLKTIEMPLLSLSRTAVDADVEGHLAEHLKNTIYAYLRTDTLLFYEDRFDKRYKTLVEPLIQQFSKKFNMTIVPSDSL
jgi:ATP synthase F1 complex assembly factor 2